MVTWCLIPVLNGWAMTEQVIYDLLGQSTPTKILVLCQGVDDELRDYLEHLSEKFPDRIFCVFWNPPLPSLSAAWNQGLEMVWTAGETEALVVNNDIRLHPRTIELLRGCLNVESNLLVSAVGVTSEQFQLDQEHPLYWYDYAKREVVGKGGPDFSCFLIAKECHRKYPFDENFIPAYLEDIDTHRRIMLAGEGHRIFSVNVPFLHETRSQTLLHMTPEARARVERQITLGSRAYYERKWGGPVNEETFYAPFSAQQERWNSLICGPTTPELQAYVQSTVRTSTVQEEDL